MLLFFPGASRAAGSPARSAPERLLAQVQRAAAEDDLITLASLCSEAERLREGNGPQSPPQAAALAKAAELFKAKGVCQDGQPAAARPPQAAAGPYAAADDRVHGLRDAVADTNALFDGRRRRSAGEEPVLVVAAARSDLAEARPAAAPASEPARAAERPAATPEAASPVASTQTVTSPPQTASPPMRPTEERRIAPTPRPRVYKPAHPCTSNLDGFQQATSSAARREILQNAASLLIFRAGVADEGDRKAACFSARVEEFLSTRRTVCVRTSVDDGELLLTYSQEPGRPQIRRFGRIEALSCEEPAPARTPDVERRVPRVPGRRVFKPVHPCRSNLEGYLQATDVEARLEILREAASLIIYRVGYDDVDDSKAACFSEQVERFLATRRAICVRTSADADGLMLTYSEQPGRDVIKRYGQVEDISCEKAASTPPPTPIAPTPPAATPPAPAVAAPERACVSNIAGYQMAETGTGGPNPILGRAAEGLVRDNFTSTTTDSGRYTANLQRCMQQYLKAYPPPSGADCLNFGVVSRDIHFSYSEQSRGATSNKAGELLDWAERGCVPVAAENRVGRPRSSPSEGSGGGGGGGGGGGPRGGGGGGGGGGGDSGGGSPSAPSPSEPGASPPAAPAASPAPPAAPAPGGSPAPVVPASTAPAPAPKAAASGTPVEKQDPEEVPYHPAKGISTPGSPPMQGHSAGGDLPLPTLTPRVRDEYLRDAAALSPVYREPKLAASPAVTRRKPKPARVAKAKPQKKTRPQTLIAPTSLDEDLRDALNAGPASVKAGAPAVASCGTIPLWTQEPDGWTSGCFPPKAPNIFQRLWRRLVRAAGGVESHAPPISAVVAGAYPRFECVQPPLPDAPPGWTSGCYPDPSPLAHWPYWLLALLALLTAAALLASRRKPRRALPAAPPRAPAVRRPQLVAA